MSIRLDPRRLAVLKRLAAEAGVRPGDLVLQWTQERLDAERSGPGAGSVAEQLASLTARVAALEAATGSGARAHAADASEAPDQRPPAEAAESAVAADEGEAAGPAPGPKRSRRATSAAARARVPLHEEMIAVLSERGPMTAAELATLVAERGRYHPPRSGKPIDAAMISQRVSNPTYRARFTRREGRIGLAD